MDEVNGQVAAGEEDIPRYCFDCRHELVDVGTSACPECGRWFDPENSRTCYRRRPGRLACLMMEPAGWPSVAFASALGLLVLIAFSVPEGYFTLVIIVILAIPIAIAALVCDAFVSMMVSLKMGRPWLSEIKPGHEGECWRRDQLKWLIAPVIVGSAFILVVLDVPVRFTFWVSRSALLEVMEEYQADPGVMPSGYAGLLPVRWISVNEWNAEGDVASTVWLDAGFIDEAGFAYVPDAEDDEINLGYDLGYGGVGWRYSGDWFLVRSAF